MRAILILFISLLTFVLSTSGQDHISSEFYRTWLRFEYYNDICAGKSPHESMGEEPVMQLYFFEKINKLLIGSFNEGIVKDFIIKNSDTILTFSQNNNQKIEYIISLFWFKNERRLKVNDGKSEFILIGLDKKYYYRNGVDRFINDKIITGDYISSTDSTLKVSFSSEGKVQGLSNYFEYWIPTTFFELPFNFNTIILRFNQSGKKISNVFYWKKLGDNIILYNLDKTFGDIDFSNAKIVDKYLILNKVR